MRVAVLGAGGTIAPAIVRDLAESTEVTELWLLDLDRSRAQAVAHDHGGGKATAAWIDARGGELGDALRGCDVLVNAASYRVNLAAMNGCLAAGCHYVDLGGLYWMTGRQLELDDDFRRAGLLALLGMGSSPGKTNVMAVAAVRALGAGAVDELRVAAAGRDPDADPSRGLALPYALETLVDELTMAPVVVRDGEPLEVAPMTPSGTAWLGGPIGEAPTIYTLHSELRTFPASFECREASFRLSLEPSILPRLRELAALPPGDRLAQVVPPGPRTVSVHVVEARRGGGAARVTAITRPSERWGIGGGIVSTAAPAAAAVRLIARGAIRASGTLPPERCVDPDDLFPELEERGCEFTTEMLEAVEA